MRNDPDRRRDEIANGDREPGPQDVRRPRWKPPTKPAPWPADKVERRDPRKLKPHPRNSRVHGPEQIEFLARSMVENGVTGGVLVDEKNVILSLIHI